MEYRNNVLLQECEAIIKDKLYTIKPLSFKSILTKEFSRDNIFIPTDSEGKLLFKNLINDIGKERIDKWLKRQVSIDDKPIDLDYISKEEWEKQDFIDLFTVLLEISGLTTKDNEEKQSNNDNGDNHYMKLVANLMINRTMTYDEIMQSSLPFLIEMSKTVNERITLGGLGLFGSTTTEKANDVVTCSSPQDFYS